MGCIGNTTVILVIVLMLILAIVISLLQLVLFIISKTSKKTMPYKKIWKFLALAEISLLIAYLISIPLGRGDCCGCTDMDIVLATFIVLLAFYYIALPRIKQL